MITVSYLVAFVLNFSLNEYQLTFFDKLIFLRLVILLIEMIYINYLRLKKRSLRLFG